MKHGRHIHEVRKGLWAFFLGGQIPNIWVYEGFARERLFACHQLQEAVARRPLKTSES